ncbi:putative O-glycosylation ligase, exosortase system type 1-associated [Burkholderiales bacterium JOSHI_001]|nr:putative O-glycosylation ligase, exosortase system type 1-associated [Burkholderiales bacterium JOSHI_001]
MRDIVLVIIVAGLFIYALRKPWVSPLLWAWLSMMNPHRLTFGFAYSLPMAQAAAGLVLLQFLMPKNRHGFPSVSTAWLMVAFYLWNCVTSLASFNDMAVVWEGWVKVTKIQLLLFITMMMLRGRRQIDALVWVLVISIGFYGVKGGIHTILRGGATMVMGPPGSFIEGTNHIALAMMMVVPLMYYLLQHSERRWIRVGLWISMGLTTLSVLGTASRGALLATVTMAALLGLKSKRKLSTVLVVIIGLTLMLAFMPEQWTQKMGTIATHEDHSAQSRIYTWQMIWNMVLHHPITGGGYMVTENPATWQVYAVTEWARAYSPHSLYFQALAEHGFIGLVLYLALGISAWRRCSRVVREANTPETAWAGLLCRMVQASIAGFAVGGAFVNLVNFDLPYYFVAIAVLADVSVAGSRAEAKKAVAAASRSLPTDVRHGMP